MRTLSLVAVLVALPLTFSAHAAPAPETTLPEGMLARLGGNAGFTFGSGPGKAVVWSADGKTITAAVNGQLTTWEAKSGKVVRTATARLGSSLTASAVISPDGKRVAASGQTGKIAVADTADGKLLRTIDTTVSILAPPVWSPDSKLVAIAGSDGKPNGKRGVFLFDADSGKEVVTCPLAAISNGIVFSPDGKIVASLYFKDQVSLWETATGKAMTGGDPSPITTIGGFAFTPDGKEVYTTAEAGIVRWDPATGKNLGTIDTTVDRRTGLAFSADGKYLAAVRREDAKLFDVATGKLLHTISPLGGPGGGWASRPIWFAFSPDGKSLAITTDLRVRVWDVASGKEAFPYTGHEGRIYSVHFLADGKSAVTRGADNTVRVWDIASGKQKHKLVLDPEMGFIKSTAVAADGSSVLLVPSGKKGEETIHLLRWKPGDEAPETMPGEFLPWGAPSPDGRLWLSLEHRGKNDPADLKLQDIATGKTVRTMPIQAASVPDKVPLGFIPGGKRVWVSLGGGYQVWDAATGDLLFTVPAVEKRQLTNLWSPDGRFFLAESGAWRGMVEARTGKDRWGLDTSAFSAGAFSPDGRLLVMPLTGRVFDVATGKILATLTKTTTYGPAVFSPDGKLLALAENSTVGIWDVEKLHAKTKATEPDEDELASLWKDLAAEDATRAHRAVWKLVAAKGKAEPFLKKVVKPADGAEEKRIADLIAKLEADEFAQREAASRDLEKIGAPVLPALHKALTGTPSAELKQRVKALLEKIRPETSEPPSAQVMQSLRALEVLERLGTPEARAVVETVAKGVAGAELTREAVEVLARMKR